MGQSKAMLPSVLNGDRAVAVNIEFRPSLMQIRRLLDGNKAFARESSRARMTQAVTRA